MFDCVLNASRHLQKQPPEVFYKKAVKFFRAPILKNNCKQLLLHLLNFVLIYWSNISGQFHYCFTFPLTLKLLGKFFIYIKCGSATKPNRNVLLFGVLWRLNLSWKSNKLMNSKQSSKLIYNTIIMKVFWSYLRFSSKS